MFAGLLVRKERWGLSLTGAALALLMTLCAVAVVLVLMYPFLAITDRTSGELLVVEGWIPSQCFEETAGEYRKAQYRDVVVVSTVYLAGDKWNSGRYRSDYIAKDLITRGVPSGHLYTVCCKVVRKDRTYESALAVKNWIQARGETVKALDVVTQGSHARRSRLLFQKALGPDVKVGVIALDEWAYDPARWWCSSEGVRDVLFESVAYAYVRLFFRPS